MKLGNVNNHVDRVLNNFSLNAITLIMLISAIIHYSCHAGNYPIVIIINVTDVPIEVRQFHQNKNIM